jgi:hypothetical protein
MSGVAMASAGDAEGASTGDAIANTQDAGDGVMSGEN